MNRELSLTMMTLTPLWTGGDEPGKMDRLHETAIISSLRWWYEAVVRGIGGTACDYTDKGKPKCLFNKKEYDRNKHLPLRGRLRKAGICDVCQLFGATGWKRRFTLSVGRGTQLFINKKNKILLPSGRVHPPEKAGGWFLWRDSVMGEDIPLAFRFVDPEDVNKIKVVLKLIEKHGALGGKKSSGHGVVKFFEKKKAGGESQLLADPSVFSWAISENQPPGKRQYPDLRDLFFSRIQFTPPPNEWWFCLPENRLAKKKIVTDKINGTAPTRNPPSNEVEKNFNNFIHAGFAPLSPTIRNWLRYKWGRRLINGTKYLAENQENYLFGSTDKLSKINYMPTSNSNENDTIRGLSSKIFVSHAYRINEDEDVWEFRVWGWLPHVNIAALLQEKRALFLVDLQHALITRAFANYFSGDCATSNPFQFNKTKWMPDNDYPTGLKYLQNLLDNNEESSE